MRVQAPATRPPDRRWSLRRRERAFALALLAPCFAFVAVFAFYPILYSVYLSLHRIVLGLPQLGQPFVGLANYAALAGDAVARQALANTLIFVVASTALELLLGLAIALVINRTFPGRGAVRAAVLVPWAIPTVVSSQLWRFLYNDQYGLVNFALFGSATGHYRAWLADPTWARVALVTADVWKTSSFAALLILAGLQTIPDDLYEAARIDGAGAWHRFRRVTLPLIRPALLVALLFRTLDAFRVFDLVFVMTQGGPGDATNVLQFYGYKKIFTEGRMGYGSAISVGVFGLNLAFAVAYLAALRRRSGEGVT